MAGCDKLQVAWRPLPDSREEAVVMAVTPPLSCGPHSPFDDDERATIEAVMSGVARSGRSRAADLLAAIREHVEWLEGLGEALSRYPSPLAEQTLGERRRDLDTLIDILSRSDPANVGMYLPTRAYLARAIVMAESNFYRLLHHVCEDALAGPQGRELKERVERAVRTCLYTRLCEAVLSSIASDAHLARSVRSKAVVALAQMWEQQSTYRVAEFFPLLEATWEARQRTTVTGGTLLGASEIVQLFQGGCDPQFVDYFARPALSDDELAAFREFLFGATTEKLEAQAERMEQEGAASATLSAPIAPPIRDAASVLYHFFRSRHLKAMARRLADLPGPKRTAEEYVMIYYLDQLTESESDA
jgi:hypothetical protein